MSLDATQWAWSQRAIKASDKIVLLSMADRANESHCCWPAIDRLAADTCLNKETVIAAIDRLVSAGLLERKKRYGKSPIYRLVGVRGREETAENLASQYSEKPEFRKTGKVEPHSIPENRNVSIPENQLAVFRKPGKESLNESPKKKNKYSSIDLSTAEFIWSGVLTVNPTHKHPDIDAWANSVRLMCERDGRTHDEIIAVFTWANHDSFWSTNILSPEKLRKQFDTLNAKRLSEMRGNTYCGGRYGSHQRPAPVTIDHNDTSWADSLAEIL